MTADVLHGDCLTLLPSLASGSVDAVCTDPPYGIEFMGKDWDRLTRNCMTPQSEADQQWNASHSAADTPGTKDGMPRRMRNRPDIGGSLKYGRQMQAWHQAWCEAVLRVLKPGGYMLAFGGTRTFHRLACAVEDAGFEIRDCLMWVYGSGFPKGKGCLKPAWEPILLARKPGKGVRPLQIDGCRVPTKPRTTHMDSNIRTTTAPGWRHKPGVQTPPAEARWPANLVHDGSAEVLEAFAAFGEKKVCAHGPGVKAKGIFGVTAGATAGYYDTGTAARFFYCAKASKADRGEGNNHPCVKPLSLMKYLCRLITPPNGKVLDPFAGSGSTGKAAVLEGFDFLGMDSNADYCDIARKRIAAARAELPLFAEVS